MDGNTNSTFEANFPVKCDTELVVPAGVQGNAARIWGVGEREPG